MKLTASHVTCLLVAAFFAYLYWVNRSETNSVTIDPRSLADRQFDPFSTWRHDHPADYYRPFPLAVSPRVLPLIYQSQDKGLALEVTCPDGNSYPQ